MTRAAEVVQSIDELDGVFREVADLASEEAMLRRLSGLALRPPVIAGDPHSTEYQQAQVAFFRELVGERHVTSHPGTRHVASPEELEAVSMVVSTLGLAPGSTVIEFGADRGCLAAALADAGHAVCSVKGDESTCEVVRRRAGERDVEVVNDDFSLLARLEAPVDAVLFFRSLHRAIGHQPVFAALDAAVRPGGRVLFASEPIFDDFGSAWGPRLDGPSLWSMRRHGLLELGFSSHYFEEAMDRAGWSVRRHENQVLEARRRKAWAFRYGGGAREMHSALGKKTRTSVRVASQKEGYALFGPFAAVPEGRWRARLAVRGLDGRSPRGRCTFDVSSHGKVFASREVDLSTFNAAPLSLEFALSAPAPAVEVRLFAHEPVELEVLQVEISVLP